MIPWPFWNPLEFRGTEITILAGSTAKIPFRGIPGIDRIPADSGRNTWRTVKNSGWCLHLVSWSRLDGVLCLCLGSRSGGAHGHIWDGCHGYGAHGRSQKRGGFPINMDLGVLVGLQEGE